MGQTPTRPAPDHNRALDLLRVTEAAALAGGRWVGRGAKNDADQAAITALRTMMSTVAMDGVVVIGEGEKEQAPMLFNGERVADGTGQSYDWQSIRSTVRPGRPRKVQRCRGACRCATRLDVRSAGRSST